MSDFPTVMRGDVPDDGRWHHLLVRGKDITWFRYVDGADAGYTLTDDEDEAT